MIPFYNDRMRLGSQIGFAGKVNVNYASKFPYFNTNGMLEYIGPGYFSMGQFRHFQNNLRYNLSFGSAFCKKKIKYKLFAKQDIENLNSINPLDISRTYGYGLSASMKLRRMPGINLEYRPLYQRRTIYESQNLQSINVTGSFLQISANYNWETEWFISSTTCGVIKQSLQEMESKEPVKINQIYINQSVSIERFLVAANIYTMPSGNSRARDFGSSFYDFRVNYKMKRLDLGMTYTDVTNNAQGRRTSYGGKVHIPIFKWLSSDFSCQYNYYSISIPNYYLPKITGWILLSSKF
jgi:hypothetical protein